MPCRSEEQPRREALGYNRSGVHGRFTSRTVGGEIHVAEAGYGVYDRAVPLLEKCAESRGARSIPG